MASRAATLVQPKPKAKSKPKAPAKTIATKTIATKSLVTKAASVKSPAAAQASQTEAASIDANSSQAAVGKAPSAKASAVKSVAIKPAPAKVAKPTASAKPAAVSKSGNLKVKAKASAADDSAMVAGTASFEPTAPKPRRRSKGEIRTRIYWAVFNQALRRVAVFEFDQRAEAEKRAAKLAKASGEHHFIQKIKAIVQ